MIEDSKEDAAAEAALNAGSPEAAAAAGDDSGSHEDSGQPRLVPSLSQIQPSQDCGMSTSCVAFAKGQSQRERSQSTPNLVTNGDCLAQKLWRVLCDVYYLASRTVLGRSSGNTEVVGLSFRAVRLSKSNQIP